MSYSKWHGKAHLSFPNVELSMTTKCVSVKQRVCERTNMEEAQHKTRQPMNNQQAMRTIFSLTRLRGTSSLSLMTCTSAMEVSWLTSHTRRKTLPSMMYKGMAVMPASCSSGPCSTSRPSGSENGEGLSRIVLCSS